MTRLVGAAVDGGGYHAGTQAEHGAAFAEALGWRPFPGSLNIELEDPLPGADLPAPHTTVLARGRSYRLWRGRVAGYDGPAALMTYADRDVYLKLEILAPTRLRDVVSTRVVIELKAAP